MTYNLRDVLEKYINENLVKKGLSGYVFQTDKYSEETEDEEIYSVEYIEGDKVKISNQNNFKIPSSTSIVYTYSNTPIRVISVEELTQTLEIHMDDIQYLSEGDLLSLGNSNDNEIFIILELEDQKLNYESLATDKLYSKQINSTIFVGSKDYNKNYQLYEKIYKEICDMFMTPRINIPLDECHTLMIYIPMGILTDSKVTLITDVIRFIKVVFKIYENRNY